MWSQAKRLSRRLERIGSQGRAGGVPAEIYTPNMINPFNLSKRCSSQIITTYSGFKMIKQIEHLILRCFWYLKDWRWQSEKTSYRFCNMAERGSRKKLQCNMGKKNSKTF